MQRPLMHIALVVGLVVRLAPLDYDGTYTIYQVGRQVQGTVEVKF